MELYILSKQDLSILSICKLADYQINLDEETNAKSTFTLMKTNGLKKENYMVLNGLYRQFIFVIDDVQTEKESDVVTVTALDISNVFNRKVIEKNIDTMKSKSIEEFLANTISENFVNSDDTALNVNYIEIYWHTNTQGNVATNAENGLYNFHTFLTNCRQYKNIYTDFKLENLGNPQTVEGKRISIEAKNRKIVDISLHGESTQKTSTQSSNLFDEEYYNNDDIYTSATYKYVKARFTGNRTLYFKATLKEGKTAQTGAYIAISESKGNPYVAGTKTAYAISNGFAGVNSIDFSEITDIYVNIYPNTLECATIFDNYNLWVSTDNVTYEKFIPDSPSPDYPSEIENIEGKNKFNANGGYDYSTNTYNADYNIVNSNKIIITNQNGAWNRLGCTITGLKANIEYTVSADITNNAGLSCGFYSGQGSDLKTSTKFKSKCTYITDNNGNLASQFYTNMSGTVSNDEVVFDNIQLEEGTAATPYVPYNSLEFKVTNGLEETDENYQEQVVTFPLGEEKLMEGSYLANDGIHHKRKQVVFDGTETWSKDPNTEGKTDYFYIKNIGITENNINNVFCTHFVKGEIYKQGFWATTVFCITINKEYTGIVSSDTRDQRIAKWKTWLSEHPITVEYDLAEPEIIPYTAEQQEAWNKIKNLTLFEGVNHISSDANMVLKYYPLEPVGLKFVLRIDIENKQETTELIDTTLPEVTDYNKIYEEDVTAKVQVYIREDGSEYNLYLKTDRTTTTNKNDPDRASGKIEVISVETADKAPEEALNVMKGNNYKHLVEFKIAKTSNLMDITQLYIGRPIRIKTEDDIYDSYISALTLSDENFVYFKSGSLRITLLDKLKKSNDSAGNKLDVSGGKITGNLNINGILKNNNKTILDLTYPIGSIYLSIKNTNPSSLFGGIWEAWGSGRVPVGVDTAQTEFETVEKIGGEKTHTLTVDEMPSHNHNVKYNTESGIATASVLGTDRTASNTEGSSGGGDWYVWTTGAGGDEAHNNLQPYITCYMFKRVG